MISAQILKVHIQSSEGRGGERGEWVGGNKNRCRIV